MSFLKEISDNSIFFCQATRRPLFDKGRSWPTTNFRGALKFSLTVLTGFLLAFTPDKTGIAEGAENTFNQLLIERLALEKEHGIKSLECFPFVKKIGFTEDQIPLIENCLAGTRTLRQALIKVPKADVRKIGISDRFLRTGGFHTFLVPWNASRDKMVQFLEQHQSDEEKKQIHALKREISKNITVSQLYCTLQISNEQCHEGYQKLAKVKPGGSLKKMKWREIAISDTHVSQKDPYVLALGFDNSPEEMLSHLQQDVEKIWSIRKKGYEDIQTRYGQGFKERLQLENFFCAPDLSLDECRQGADNLFQASENEVLQEKFWGQVNVARFNTIIEDDFNVTLRYDLPTKEIIKLFAKKPSRQEATQNTILAEKQEGRSKNNHAGLRGVCDLDGLGSALCAKAFNNFIDFLKKNRDYRVAPPFANLMFVDGRQLARINFALNSSSRDTYIYVDADTGLQGLESYLERFENSKDGEK
jgi:hypothetical protein